MSSADLGTGLFAWAQSLAPLTDIIGEGDDCQFYPEALQSQKTPPFVLYDEQKDEEAAKHDSAPTAATTTITFTCIAATRADAVALADVIYQALIVPRFKGLMGDVYVQSVIYKKSNPSYEWEEYQWAVESEYVFCYNL